LSVEQYDRFSKYYQDWSSKHTSDNDIDPFNNLWLKTHRTLNNNEQQNFAIQSTFSNEINDFTQPPYRPYRQYHIVDT
jgi:hypothetical protein